MHSNNKIKILLFILFTFISFIGVIGVVKVEAKTINNYSVYRIFDLKPEETNWDLKVVPETHKVIYEIRMKEKEMDKYFSPKILLVGEDFQNQFRKDIPSYNNGTSVIGKELSSNIPQDFFKVFYTDKKNRDYKVNKGLFNFSDLEDGINNITFCVEDFSSSNRVGVYKFLRCDKNTKKLYYIKERNEVVGEEEYKNYLQEKEESNNKQREKELAFLEKINKYFDENKVKKSRFGTRSKIQTSQELQDLILNEVKSLDFNNVNLDLLATNLAGKYFTYDDNDKVFANYTDFRNYVLYTIKEYIYQKEHPEASQNTQNSNTTSTENTNTTQTTQNTNTNQYSSNNGDQALEEYKIKNANDRKRAIDFSKKLLKVLERYRTKDIKLQKIQEIRVILDTKFTPEKYSNQNLIGYVKDYLDIVEYAIQLQ